MQKSFAFDKNEQKNPPIRGALHKAGFTYRNLVGRWLAAAENKRYMQRKRREINPRPTTKGVRTICSYSFSYALPRKV